MRDDCRKLGAGVCELAQTETTVEVVVTDGAQAGGTVVYDNTFTISI